MLKRRNRLPLLLAVCSPVLAEVAAFGQTTTFTNHTGGGTWATPGNWNNGLPATTGTAIFDDTAFQNGLTTSVNLGSVTRTVNTLEFANDFLSNLNYTLASGTLALTNLIDTGSFSNGTGNHVTANITAVGGTLTANLQRSATTYLDGIVTATNLTLTDTSLGFSQGTLQLTSASNQISSISIGASTTLAGSAAGAFSGAPISIATSGILSVFTNGVTTTYGDNIHAALGSSINSDIPPTVFNSPGTAKFGALTMDPDAYVFLRGFDTTSQSFISTTLNGANAFYPAFLFNANASSTDTLGVADLGAVHQSVAGSSLTNNGPGTLRISAAGDYTGGTTAAGGLIDATADGALGHGLVHIGENAAVHVVTQSTVNFNPIVIDHYGALGGDLTGAHYSGVSKNVTAAAGTIFYGLTAGTAPVRGTDVFTPAYLAGVTSNSQTMTVGDSSTSIYYGVAFGVYSPAGAFTGAVSENSAGQGVSVYNTTGPQYLGAAAFNTVSGAAGAGGVNFFGPGEFRLTAPLAGSATVYNFTGSPDQITDTNFLATLTGINTLATGHTLNISNGVLQTGDGRSFASGSVVNVMNTGSYFLNDYGVAGVSAIPQNGTINIQSGGALYISKQTAVPTGAATFNYSPGSLLILANPLNTGSPTWISPNSDVILESGGAFTGAGIVLGNGRRLTTPDYAIQLSGGAGVSAAAGATNVLLTASDENSLEIDDAVSLSGVDLQIGDANLFNGVAGYTSRETVTQDGEVVLGGNTTTRNLTVANGDLLIFGPLSANKFAHNSTGTTTIAGATASFAGSLSVSAGVVVDSTPIHYGSSSNISVTGGQLQFTNSAKPTLPTNSLSVTIGTAGSVAAIGAADPFSDASNHRMTIANNGALTIGTTSNIAALTGTGTTTVNSASSLTTDSIRQGSLNLIANATLAIRPSGHTPGVGTPTINTLNSLSLGTGSKLDLADGDLILSYSGSSPASSIAMALATGYNAGHWNGVGIDSSAAAADATKRTAFGYIDNADFGYTTFNGQPVATNSVIVKYTYYGDSTLDGTVDLGNDFNLFLQGYLNHGTGWDFGDYNYDGVVNAADFQLFVQGYAAQGGSLGTLDAVIEATPMLSISQKASLFSVVPEPSSVVIAIAACGLAASRRRSRCRGE